MKKLTEFFSDRITFNTIRSRILLISISLVLLISSVITFISYQIVSYNLQQNLLQTSETRLSFLCTSVNSDLDSIKSFVRSCQISSKISAFALESAPSDNISKREAHEYMTETYHSNVALSSRLIRLVVIGKEREDIVQVVGTSNSSIAVTKDNILSLSYFDTLAKGEGLKTIGIAPDPFFTTRNMSMIPFVYPIYHPYKADIIGYIFVEMSTAALTLPVQSYLAETGSSFYLQIDDKYYRCEENTLIPCSENPFLIKEDLTFYALNEDTDIHTVQNTLDLKNYIALSRPLDIDGWYITECVDTSQLTKDITRTFLLILFIIITLATLIGMLLSMFLFRTVTVPVDKLQARMNRISEGDFSRDPSTEWDHELGEIGKAINDLTENVYHLMNQKIEDEKQKKDYEYKMLQSQINPHFLYNTLNSIKWMATIQNAPGIAEMTTSLSRLLKDISKGTKSLISIRHELALIRDYFTIQQYRYGGIITLDITTEDPAIENCEILKFTLQPLVENAIFHGIEPKGTAGRIQIHSSLTSGGDVRIDVTDDGIGMDDKLITSVLEGGASGSASFFKEIGVSNVHKRLQYEFGTPYGLSISSVPNEYTTVSILLPFKECEETYAETADR